MESGRSGFRTTEELHHTFWSGVEPKLPLLQDIISAHFGLTCSELSPMGGGSFSHIYRGTIENGLQVIARIVLPVRDQVKTEAEIATMDSIRCKHTMQQLL